MDEKKPNPINDEVATKIARAKAISDDKSDMAGSSPVFERSKYDDPYKRSKFKESEFDGKKTIEDYYTGNILHRNTIAAKKKYGDEYHTSHTSDVDHIVPVKTIHETWKNNPFLTDGDIKEIANIEYNYRITSSKYNRSKADRSNIDVVLGEKLEVDLHSKTKIVVDDVKAKTAISTMVAGKTIINAGTDFAQGAKNSLDASAIPLLIMGTQNLILVAKGEKRMEDAIKDTGKEMIATVASGGAIRVTTTALTNTFKNSSTQMLRNVGNSNYVAQIITVALIVKDSFISYVNGEISGEEFMEQIHEDGVAAVGSIIGSIVGQALIPIPLVGAFIGSVIVSTVCVEIQKFSNKINKEIIETYKNYDESEKLMKNINILADSALRELAVQRTHLKGIIGNEFEKWDLEFNSAFDLMIESTLNDDVEGVANSLDKILKVFNENVRFKTFEEFDEFFMDENAILKI